MRNLLCTNIDVHSRRLIAKFPGDGVKCISKLQSNCANMTFLERSDMIDFSKKFKHKGGGSEMNYIKIFQNAQAMSISVGKKYSEDH